MASLQERLDEFKIDRTHPGQWTITFTNPPINMFVPTTIVELGALMTDLEADPERIAGQEHNGTGRVASAFGRKLKSRTKVSCVGVAVAAAWPVATAAVVNPSPTA